MNRQAITAELIRDEGLRLKPYRCTAGALTVGVGRNLDAVGISEVEARVLLSNDIERVWCEVTQALPWVTGLSDARQRVILNMGFNLGISGLLEFKRTLSAIKEGRYSEAALFMLESRWAGQVGDRAKRLSRMMREG
jgi:lysozyme